MGDRLSLRALVPVFAKRWLGLSLALAGAGCGEGFDPPNEVKTLRVFGVHKSASYVKPGSDVTANLIWEDASPKAPRDVTIAWLPACINPPGDLYYGCFEQLGTGETAGIGSLSQEFSFRIPEDIVSSRPRPDPGNPQFGTAFAFFILCAGEITQIDPPSRNALPIGCRDRDSGELLGPDDFTAGYTQFYAFADGFDNQKPTVTGFQVGGIDVPTDCLGAECAKEGTPIEEQPPVPIDCEAQSQRCVLVCEDDGDDECPDIDVRPVVSREVAERDAVAATYYDRDVSEQLWINYYSDRGGMASPVRLLNDATEGWNDKFGAKFHAPAEPGPVQIWAVVHDNRGGADFVRVTIQAR